MNRSIAHAIATGQASQFGRRSKQTSVCGLPGFLQKAVGFLEPAGRVGPRHDVRSTSGWPGLTYPYGVIRTSHSTGSVARVISGVRPSRGIGSLCPVLVQPQVLEKTTRPRSSPFLLEGLAQNPWSPVRCSLQKRLCWQTTGPVRCCHRDAPE